MLSQTRRTLEEYDNQHDFERMAADVLNALGYSDVEPMAPGGGADGGRDIKFREGDTLGIAFVTLNKNIKKKFSHDLSKQDDKEGLIALFCNVDVSPSEKLAFTKEAMAKGYRLMVLDLERLRCLFDARLKDIRRRYLHIDDEIATRLRSEVRKLLKFPDAIPNDSEAPTLLEQFLSNKIPCRLFELLMRYEENDIIEVPEIGVVLHNHLKDYYRFRQEAVRFEADLMSRIATIIGDCFNSQARWNMYFRYALLRFLGITQDKIIAGGNFLNYGITWDGAETIFVKLSDESAVTSHVAQLDKLFDKMVETLDSITPN
jgi:hypothetical protein